MMAIIMMDGATKKDMRAILIRNKTGNVKAVVFSKKPPLNSWNTLENLKCRGPARRCDGFEFVRAKIGEQFDRPWPGR